MSQGESKGIWSRAFIELLAFDLLVQFGTTFVNPITSNYAVAMGATVTIAGFLAGLNATVSCVLRPFGGLVLQKISRRNLLLVSAGIFAAAALVSAVFPSVFALGLSRVAMGVSFIIKSSIVVSLASACVPEEHVGQGVGTVGLSTIIASALGPGVGSQIGQAFGYNVTFLVAGGLFFAAMLVALFIEDPCEKRKDWRTECATDDAERAVGQQADESYKAEKQEAVFNSRAALKQNHHFNLLHIFYVDAFPVAGLAVFEAFIYGSAIGLVLLVGEQRSIAGAPLFFFAYALVAILSRPFTTKLYDRFGLRPIYYPTVVLMCLSMLSLAFAQDEILVVAGGVFLALGQGGLYPCLQTESVSHVPADKTPLAINTFYIGADAGMAIGPFVSGAVLNVFGSFPMFILNVCVGAVMLLLYLPYERRKKRLAVAKD